MESRREAHYRREPKEAQEPMRGGPLLGLFYSPLHDDSHFTLTASGIAEEW